MFLGPKNAHLMITEYDGGGSYDDREDRKPVKTPAVETFTRSAAPPSRVDFLDWPLKMATGFYFDDEEIGWELGNVEFGAPKSIRFMIALPAPSAGTEAYDLIEFRLPVTQDENGRIVYDYERPYTATKKSNNIPRDFALHELAAYANPAVKSADGFRDRELPRVKDTDPAFRSFLDAVNFRIGTDTLSDVPNFKKIEGLVAHPDTRYDLPSDFRTSVPPTDLDTAPVGTRQYFLHATSLCRRTPSKSLFPFAPQTTTRDVSLDDVNNGDVPKIPPLPYSFERVCDQLPKPRMLDFISNKERYRQLDLLNQLVRKTLPAHGIQVVSYSPVSENKPLNGIISIKANGFILDLKIYLKLAIANVAGKHKWNNVDHYIFGANIHPRMNIGGYYTELISHSLVGSRYHNGRNKEIDEFASFIPFMLLKIVNAAEKNGLGMSGDDLENIRAAVYENIKSASCLPDSSLIANVPGFKHLRWVDLLNNYQNHVAYYGSSDPQFDEILKTPPGTLFKKLALNARPVSAPPSP